MSDNKYEWEETEFDHKAAIGGVATVIGSIIGLGIKAFSSIKKANKDMQIARDKDELNRLNSKFIKTSSDRNRIRELNRDINNLKK
ncbi:hypothetical protein KQI69_05000 [Eubacterium sp. MSJ-13]|uniref:hypothetical protein n=1 Tax=Eubacterium sp. MSJ-13 TaxID=2841513 RepID=UPI001C1269C6|nr:hypothetical protein [Eubacterium sp. MSJ-13]MBU5478557.1 hypothetical protein [Eubacterium sp. MSJ-13]